MAKENRYLIFDANDGVKDITFRLFNLGYSKNDIEDSIIDKEIVVLKVGGGKYGNK
jgi:hypothetical protein